MSVSAFGVVEKSFIPGRGYYKASKLKPKGREMVRAGIERSKTINRGKLETRTTPKSPADAAARESVEQTSRANMAQNVKQAQAAGYRVKRGKSTTVATSSNRELFSAGGGTVRSGSAKGGHSHVFIQRGPKRFDDKISEHENQHAKVKRSSWRLHGQIGRDPRKLMREEARADMNSGPRQTSRKIKMRDTTGYEGANRSYQAARRAPDKVEAEDPFTGRNVTRRDVWEGTRQQYLAGQRAVTGADPRGSDYSSNVEGGLRAYERTQRKISAARLRGKEAGARRAKLAEVRRRRGEVTKSAFGIVHKAEEWHLRPLSTAERRRIRRRQIAGTAALSGGLSGAMTAGMNRGALRPAAAMTAVGGGIGAGLAAATPAPTHKFERRKR